ncbi:hypothetical protein ACJX0J_015962, partial [Zea mays]
MRRLWIWDLKEEDDNSFWVEKEEGFLKIDFEPQIIPSRLDVVENDLNSSEEKENKMILLRKEIIRKVLKEPFDMGIYLPIWIEKEPMNCQFGCCLARDGTMTAACGLCQNINIFYLFICLFSYYFFSGHKKRIGFVEIHMPHIFIKILEISIIIYRTKLFTMIKKLLQRYPAQKYPKLFSEESIFGRFPYFLPCFVISVLAVGSCIACIWLPETLHFHDDEKAECIQELESQVGGSKSTENLLKNWPLMSAIILFSIFSLHDTAYLEIFSLWAVSSRKFQGLSFTSQDVGTVFAFSGLSVLVYQLTIYPLLSKYFGPVKIFRPAVILSIILLITYPFMSNLHGLELKILVNIASILKNVFAATITIACNILQNTAVTQKQRGTANGISVTMMSMFKAAAPAAAGIIFSWAQKHIYGLFLP